VLGVLVQVLCLDGIAARGSFSGNRQVPLMALVVGSAGRALAPLRHLWAKPRAPALWLIPHAVSRPSALTLPASRLLHLLGGCDECLQLQVEGTAVDGMFIVTLRLHPTPDVIDGVEPT
jgi:hypothetical protein